MTTTEARTTAPTITPCPIPWCDQADRHPWAEIGVPLDDQVRYHRGAEAHLPFGVTIAAEVYETRDGANRPTIDINATGSGFELSSPQQVAAFVLAVTEAARIAFSGPLEGGGGDYLQ